MLVGKTLHERLHVESVVKTSFLLFTTGRDQKLLVRIEQAGEASYECSSDLVGMESSVTNQAHLRCASVMNCKLARRAFVHALLGSVITDGADQFIIPWLGLEEVTLNPAGALCGVDILRSSLGYNG